MIIEEYGFVGRQKELEKMKAAFSEKVIHDHGFMAFLIQGRRGIGKTRLVKEFIDSLESDVALASDIPEFDKQRHVITYDCNESTGKPYEPFIKIGKEIERRQFLFQLVYKAVTVILAVININDSLVALGDLWLLVRGKQGNRASEKKEIREFNKYRRVLKSFNRKSPLVIFIQNIERIDRNSLKLIEKILFDRKPLWGMIILEECEQPFLDATNRDALDRMVGAGKISRMPLMSLSKDFPARMLNPYYGDGLFDGADFDMMFALSEGCPGLLVEQVELWKSNKWIEKGEGGWKKVGDFKDRIKPKYQKLLETIISLFEDGKLEEGEERLIRRMAAEWEIPGETVTRTIGNVRDIQSIGYKILRRLGEGIVSVDSFLAFDDLGERCIVEYLTNEKKIQINPRHRDIVHANLIEAKEIRSCGQGVLIRWDDLEKGRKIRDMIREAHEQLVSKTVNIVKQVSRALAELHRNGEVHGFVQPEAIVEIGDGKFCLASFDPALLQILPFATQSERQGYLAPEVLTCGQPDTRSDIFSLGVVFFKLLTDRLPFAGSDRDDLLESMRCRSISSQMRSREIPEPLQHIIARCLEPDPDDRYQSANAFLEDLEKVPPVKEVDENGTDQWRRRDQEEVRSKEEQMRRSRRKKAAISMAFLLALGVGIYLVWPRKPYVVCPEITVSIQGGGDDSDTGTPVSRRMVQFLIMDDIQQSSDQSVMSQSMFDRNYPPGQSPMSVPKLKVSGVIQTRALSYNLKISVSAPPFSVVDDTTLTFSSPSTLLSLRSQVTRFILHKVGVGLVKPSAFTQNWDAFQNFFAGDTAWRRLDPTSAEKKYKHALEIDPSFVLARVRLADVYRFLGKREEALTELRTAWPFLARLGRADSLRAEGLRMRLSGELWGASKVYADIAEVLPGRATAKYEVAEVYFELCEIGEAINWYKKALEVNRLFSPAFNHLGYCYSHRGEHDSALACFKRYVAIDSSANSFDSMGDGYFAAGQLDSAAWSKEEGIRRDPDLGYLYSALAYINIRAGRLSEARTNIGRYMQYAGTNPSFLGVGHAASAYLYFVSNDLTRALSECNQSLGAFDSNELVSRNHQVHWLRGIVYLRLGMLNDARHELTAMDQIITANGVNSQRYNQVYKFKLHLKALLDAQTNRMDSVKLAIEEFDDPSSIMSKVKDHSSPFDLAFFNTAFGEMYLRQNLPQLAEERFKRALVYNPKYASAHFYLGRLYEGMGKADEARRETDLFRALWAGADQAAMPERVLP